MKKAGFDFKKKNLNLLLGRLRRLHGDVALTSTTVRSALRRIAKKIVELAKENVIREDIIRTSSLYNAIRFDIVRSGGQLTVVIGALGLDQPYAPLQEHGDVDFTDQQRAAMFARMRDMGQLDGNSKFITVGEQFEARPFLQPAFEAYSKNALAIMSRAIMKG